MKEALEKAILEAENKLTEEKTLIEEVGDEGSSDLHERVTHN